MILQKKNYRNIANENSFRCLAKKKMKKMALHKFIWNFFFRFCPSIHVELDWF